MNRRRAWQLAFVVSCVVNLVVIYAPETGPDVDIPLADKAIHMLVFGLAAYTGLKARLPATWLGGALVLNAATSELVQHYWLAHRSGDVFDAVADVAGVLAGTLLAGGLTSWRRGPR